MSDTVDPLRLDLFRSYGVKIAELAYQALKKGEEPESFVGLIVDANDAQWSWLAQSLAPNTDFGVADPSKLCIMVTLVGKKVSEVVALGMPRFKDELVGPMPPGMIRVLVLAGEGISIFLLQPQKAENMPS